MEIKYGVFRRYEDRYVLGRHVLVELRGVSSELLDSLEEVEKILSDSANVGEVTVEGVLKHKFNPNGLSMILLLSESHISIHTWPEIGFAAIDIFTCGGKPEKIAEYIIDKFKPKKSSVQVIDRGIIKR